MVHMSEAGCLSLTIRCHASETANLGLMLTGLSEDLDALSIFQTMAQTQGTICFVMDFSLNQCPLFSLVSRCLLALQYYHQPHYAKHGLFQPGVFAQQDRNVSDKGDEADDTTNDVLLAVQVGLTRGVELGVVCEVVVTFREEAEGRFSGQ
jgi:hypothetical protein